MPRIILAQFPHKRLERLGKSCSRSQRCRCHAQSRYRLFSRFGSSLDQRPGSTRPGSPLWSERDYIAPIFSEPARKPFASFLFGCCSSIPSARQRNYGKSNFARSSGLLSARRRDDRRRICGIRRSLLPIFDRHPPVCECLLDSITNKPAFNTDIFYGGRNEIHAVLFEDFPNLPQNLRCGLARNPGGF
jgi:hypothetical protein